MKIQSKQGEEMRNLAGPNIKEIRENCGMTQLELVERLKECGINITACTLSKMETAKRSITDIELVALAKTLNVPVEVLLRYIG